MPAAHAPDCMFDEWQAARVPADGGLPTDGDWQPVSVPGSPSVFAGAEAVGYRTSFGDPREDADEGVRAVLTLRGCYAHTRVWLNGQEIATHDNYLAPLRVTIDPAAENDLVVVCRRPEDRFGGVHETDLVPPEDSVPGIWWGVDLTVRETPFVDAMTVAPRVTGEDATLDVRATVVAAGPLDDRITYSVKPEGDLRSRGMMERGAVATDAAGRSVHEHTVAVRDPARWWPADLGDQHRYTLQAKLDDRETTVTTGICEVDATEDGAGLEVNGHPLRLRGANLLTGEPEDIERARSANANLVRAYARGLPAEVYDAADEAGVLVWQDLPLTGPGEFDLERGQALAAALARRHAHHPSLATIGVHDRPTDAFRSGLGSGVLDRLRLRWRAWRSDYDPSAAEAVAEAVADRYPTVPVVADPGVASDVRALFPGWDYGSPGDVDALLDRYPASTVAAFGAAALADDVSLDGGEVASGDIAGFDGAKHAAHVDGRDPAASQAYQATVLETVAGRLRQRGLDAVAFALRDTDAAGPGVYTSDGEPKAGRDALATAFAPTQVFLTDPSPGESRVVVVNDRPEAVDGTVRWQTDAGDDGDFDASVGAGARDTVATVDLPGEGARVELALVAEGVEVTNAYTL
jgi:beta-mannosidase